MKTSDLKIAIVGCGAIGARHAGIIASQYQLTALCDVDRSKAEKLAEGTGARCFEKLEDLLANSSPDVLAVCTPNGLHAEHSILALNNGVNVLCEKPMAIKPGDCAAMIAAANIAGKQLYVVKQNRFNPPVAAVKRLLNEGVLGELTSFQLNCFWHRPESYYKNTWHGSLLMDGGTLFTQFSHFIDILYWFLGDIESLQAIGGNFQHKGMMEFEDCGAVLLKMKNGSVGTLNYNVNATDCNMEGSITLFGSKGTVKIGGEYLNTLSYFKVKGMEAPGLQSGNAANSYGFYNGSMNNHEEVYIHLRKALKGEPASLPDAEDAMKTVDIICRIYEKLRER